MTNNDITAKIKQINADIKHRKCIIKLTENYYNCKPIIKGSELVANVFDSKNIAIDKKGNLYEHFIVIKELKDDRFTLSTDTKWIVDNESGLEYSIYLLINEPQKFPEISGSPEVMDLIDSTKQ